MVKTQKCETGQNAKKGKWSKRKERKTVKMQNACEPGQNGKIRK